ncbi:hypothetical protein DAI22_11g188451 [Oryza sativa Japonica Group]|nr:hypothetical protein DAI22_11g188451 [Oryza sativa Japonica Group]
MVICSPTRLYIVTKQKVIINSFNEYAPPCNSGALGTKHTPTEIRTPYVQNVEEPVLLGAHLGGNMLV